MEEKATTATENTDTPKKTSLTGKLLVWFLVASTGVVIYITIKLLIVSFNFRDI